MKSKAPGLTNDDYWNIASVPGNHILWCDRRVPPFPDDRPTHKVWMPFWSVREARDRCRS